VNISAGSFLTCPLVYFLGFGSDEADIGAILEHQGGHGVAEEVTGPDFAESRQVLS
jgi:hypothetical protein